MKSARLMLSTSAVNWHPKLYGLRALLAQCKAACGYLVFSSACATWQREVRGPNARARWPATMPPSV